MSSGNKSTDPFEGLAKENFDQFSVDIHLTGNAFEDLLGRAPTDQEKIRLLRIQKTLGIQDDDSLWLILLALQYHMSLYEQIPNKILASAKAGSAAALKEIKALTDQQIARIRERGDRERIRIYEDCGETFFHLKKEALFEIIEAVKTEVGKVRPRSPWAYFWVSIANAGLVFGGLAIGMML